MEWANTIVDDIDKKYKMDEMISDVFKKACYDIKNTLKQKEYYLNRSQEVVDSLVILFNKFFLRIADEEINFDIKNLIERTHLNKIKNVYDCNEEEIKKAVQYFIKDIYMDEL
jgi:hypothetical protein